MFLSITSAVYEVTFKMSRISQWFWSESVWLPENTTWSDVANIPGRKVIYADIKDFLYIIPFGLVVFLVRFLLERYCLTPLGKYLDIEDTRPRKVPHNAKLEAAYLSKKPNFPLLAKQLDMTERQVAVWWRLRSIQDKPSRLFKFCESAWKAIFYILVTVYGLYILWDKEWFWKWSICFDGYPHQGVTDDVRWYYMFQTANSWCVLIFQFSAVKRKDALQMYIHHFATITLASFSWIGNMYRIGTLVFILHDCGDITLEIGKSLKYARYHGMCNCMFVIFVIKWIVTRIIIFPFGIISITTDYARTCPLYYLMKALLWLLYCLHIVWTWYILQAAYRALKAGQVEGDVRSSDSEDEISDHKD